MKKLLLTIMVFVFGMNVNAADLSVEKNEGDKLPYVIVEYCNEIIINND